MEIEKIKSFISGLKNIKLNKINLDRISEKLFSGKIDKKDLKGNLLLNLSLLIRHFIVTHKNMVTMILVSVAGAIIVIALYISSFEAKVNKANTQFEIGLSLYKRAFFDEKLSPEERGKSLSDSIKQFGYVIHTFSSTPIKYDALMYQANAFFELQDYNNALKKYQELLDKKSHYYFADQILINIGKCNEQLNNLEGAIAAYQKVVNQYKNKPAVAQAKFQIARLNEMANKVNEAIQGYQDLIRDHARSIWSQEARRRLLFLQTMAPPQPKQTPKQKLPSPGNPPMPSPQSIDQLLK